MEDVDEFIGKIGESLLNLWCSKAGMTANRSVEDSKGWDFLLQFSSVDASEKMRDKSDDEITAFVQVKATKNPKNQVYMKLSNWNSLVRNPVPAFVLYIVLDTQDEPQKVYFVHIDEEYIEATLRELRSLGKKKA